MKPELEEMKADRIRIAVAVNVRRYDTYEVDREEWAALAGRVVCADWCALNEFERAALGVECVEAADEDLNDLLLLHGELVDTSHGELSDDPQTSVLKVEILEGEEE